MRLTTLPAGQQTAYRIIIDEVPDYSPAGGKYGGDEGLFNYQRTGCRFRFGRLPFGIHVRQQQHHRRTAHPKPPLQHQSERHERSQQLAADGAGAGRDLTDTVTITLTY
ncbi:hypothetical protein [Dickeya fangzhongdai]|uniref:hypothetical protein n=1 Tax=Dickeya fangzhongdai TaxID=1778540 RepID=UPI001F5B4C53|nr:hypothetical protein [Dickeya fangzhongdai]